MLIIRSSFGRILVVLTGVLIILSALGVLNMGVGSFIEFIIGSFFLAHGIYGILVRKIQEIVWILIGCILISVGMTRIRTRWRP